MSRFSPRRSELNTDDAGTASRSGPTEHQAAAPDHHIHFPDVPKLELDQLIDQLIERAEGVKRAQGRLRTLLGAIESVNTDLSLETVLRSITEAACQLANARYAALGVIGSDGLLEQFVHVGMDEPTVSRIGALPQGKGLLGALISDPRPIRLARLADDGRSSGFPPGHPPMSSFLGVPIYVRGTVYGNLYLTDSTAGEFSDEDEELVVALAMAAGTSISNARLYQESQQQQLWLNASLEISAQVLAQTGEDPLQLIARRALEVADADGVLLSLLTPENDSLITEVALGDDFEGTVGHRWKLSGTYAERVLEASAPLLAVHGSQRGGDSMVVGPLTTEHGSLVEYGPLMALPLRDSGRSRGVLTIVRRRGRRAFVPGDLMMAGGFAGHASVALELAESRAAEQRVALLEERDRIARDLHDHVIQELFAIGMSLESVAAMLPPTEQLGDRVRQRVEDIDRTIRRIRTSIFALRGPLDGAAAHGVRQTVMEITSELSAVLGFPPHLSFAGQLDFLDGGLDDDIVAVVRETLTNVAKHAHASQVSVDVVAAAGELTVTVTDDGVGVGGATRASGTANLRSRAERRGGTFTLTPAATGGTIATWKAPLK